MRGFKRPKHKGAGFNPLRKPHYSGPSKDQREEDARRHDQTHIQENPPPSVNARQEASSLFAKYERQQISEDELESELSRLHKMGSPEEKRMLESMMMDSSASAM